MRRLRIKFYKTGRLGIHFVMRKDNINGKYRKINRTQKISSIFPLLSLKLFHLHPLKEDSVI